MGAEKGRACLLEAQSEVIRRNQAQSGAIRRNQAQSEAT